jgi:hypothetical protein
MQKNDFTLHAENGMRVRHDAQARFTVTAGRQILEDDLMPVQTIGGAVTRASIMYNQSSMSGGVSWWNPVNGKPISRPKFQIRVRPEDILTGDTLCDCSKCEEEGKWN